MPYKQRSFGWIQDAGDIFKLRSIAEIFVFGSSTHQRLVNELIPSLVPQYLGRDSFLFELNHEPIEIPYGHLKGKGPQNGETRANASCSGIAQAVLPAQNGRLYSSDWATESYIRFAVSLGIISYDNESDLCRISQAGLKLVNTEPGSIEERKTLGDILLMYPPASRILNLLRDNGNMPMSKFSIGQQLGFIGEKGFSSYPEYLISEAIYFADSKERKRIKSDVEGTSDKYARMICGWLIQLGWVSKCKFDVVVNNGVADVGSVSMIGYRITLQGLQALKKSLGSSSHPKIPKLVKYEMLATAESNSKALRLRRAHIIDLLSSKSLSLLELEDALEHYGCWADSSVINDDINGLVNIGLNVKSSDNKYKIDDSITGLAIPDEDTEEKTTDDGVSLIKNELRTRLNSVNHKYLSIIDYAYDPSSSLLFELNTIDLLNKELGFNAIHLGHSNRPDGIWTIDNHGIIIDNKSYSQGFSIPANQRREMKDYIDQNAQRNPLINSTRWWENFPSTNTSFSYLFVSSFFCGQFLESMNVLSAQTNTKGASISARSLLLLAEQIKNKAVNNQSLINLFTSNNEIVME